MICPCGLTCCDCLFYQDEIYRILARLRDQNDVFEYFIIKRLYTPDENTYIMGNAGFHCIKIYGNWNGDAYNADYERMLVLAEK